MAFNLGTKATWPLLGLVALIMIIVVVNKQNEPLPTGSTGVSGSNGTKDVADDTNEETLRKISSQYLAQEQRAIKLQQQLDELQQQSQALPDESTESSETRLEAIIAREVDRVRSELIQLNDQVTGTTEYLAEPVEPKPSSPAGAYSDYILNDQSDMEGLGWDQSNASNQNASPLSQSRIPGYASIVPLTHQVPAALATNLFSPGDDVLQEPAVESAPVARPYKTIPARSTLLGAKAMTALIGRVPVSGRVEDPYPVKLIVGRKNLAANGHTIHGLEGIIFDGIARGDWNLGCVSVEIVGGTYVFDDGRIQHLTTETGEGVDSATAVSSGQRIGYISNPQGLPCIPGKRITDAHKQAAFLALLSYGSGTFRARAQNELTTTVSGATGTSTSSVTGDSTAFETNAAVADSLDVVSDIYQERVNTTTDAVVVEGGRDVAIHITHDLYLDYHPDGRLLQYSDATGVIYQPTRLD